MKTKTKRLNVLSILLCGLDYRCASVVGSCMSVAGMLRKSEQRNASVSVVSLTVVSRRGDRFELTLAFALDGLKRCSILTVGDRQSRHWRRGRPCIVEPSRASFACAVGALLLRARPPIVRVVCLLLLSYRPSRVRALVCLFAC